MATDIQTASDKLGALTLRERSLNERLIVHKANFTRAQQDLADLEAEAMKAFGTSDINDLRKIYKDINDANNASLHQFVGQLDELERKLNEVDHLLSDGGH